MTDALSSHFSPRRLGAAIAARRVYLGLSQQALAERLGVASSETVSRYERGEREPRVSTLLRLAEALELTADELLRQAVLALEADDDDLEDFEDLAIVARTPVDTQDLAREVDAVRSSSTTMAYRPEDLQQALLLGLDVAARFLARRPTPGDAAVRVRTDK